MPELHFLENKLDWENWLDFLTDTNIFIFEGDFSSVSNELKGWMFGVELYNWFGNEMRQESGKRFWNIFVSAQIIFQYKKWNKVQFQPTFFMPTKRNFKSNSKNSCFPTATRNHLYLMGVKKLIYFIEKYLIAKWNLIFFMHWAKVFFISLHLFETNKLILIVLSRLIVHSYLANQKYFRFNPLNRNVVMACHFLFRCRLMLGHFHMFCLAKRTRRYQGKNTRLPTNRIWLSLKYNEVFIFQLIKKDKSLKKSHSSRIESCEQNETKAKLNHPRTKYLKMKLLSKNFIVFIV